MLLHEVIIVPLRLRAIKAFVLIQKPNTDITLCIPIWLGTRSRVHFWNYSSPLSSFSQLPNFIFLNLIWCTTPEHSRQATDSKPDPSEDTGGPPDYHGDDTRTCFCTVGQFMSGTNYDIWTCRGKQEARLIISDLVWVFVLCLLITNK